VKGEGSLLMFDVSDINRRTGLLHGGCSRDLRSYDKKSVGGRVWLGSTLSQSFLGGRLAPRRPPAAQRAPPWPPRRPSRGVRGEASCYSVQRRCQRSLTAGAQRGRLAGRAHSPWRPPGAPSRAHVAIQLAWRRRSRRRGPGCCRRWPQARDKSQSWVSRCGPFKGLSPRSAHL